MSYELRSATALTGVPCRYGRSKLQVRGPQRNLDEPYLSFVGGTDVFGCYVENTFVADVESHIGRTCVNFGSRNAGVDSFLNDPYLLDIAARGELCVVQLMGAQNLSNRYYKVHPRRNDRFVCARTPLIDLFPEVDFTDFHFTKHLLTSLRNVSSERFEHVLLHLQDNWLARMEKLIDVLQGNVVLLWLRRAAPEGGDGLGDVPTLVEASMVQSLKSNVLDIVEVNVICAERAQDMDGMLYRPVEEGMAKVMLGPKEHKRVAQNISECLSRVLLKH